MKKQVKLVKKVKCLLRRLRCPRFLHKFGPKTYELYEYLVPLLIRHFCKGMSYRRIVKLLDLFGFDCPSKSTLQYNAKKIPSWLWDKVLKFTSGSKHHIVALDATGFSMRNPSYHYLKRIDGKNPKIYTKLNCSLDTKTKKFISAKIRIKPRHDVVDAKYLIKQSESNIIVADKGYNSEKLYELASNNNILFMSPEKKKTKRGFFRNKMKKQFRIKTYNRRQVIESQFGGVKRKSGSSVNSKSAKSIRADIYCKLICHNLLGRFSMT